MASEPARWTQEEIDRYMAQFGQAGTIEIRGPLPTSRPQPKRGVMNKGEELFAAILESRKRTNDIVKWRFESISLLLAPKVGTVAASRYTPDFSVYWFDPRVDIYRTAFYEVKAGRKRKSGAVGAHFEDGAREKLLWAAREYPEYDFYLAWRWKGQWEEERISA